jgi:Skp family chaperone for outer membrane proteins
MVDDELDDRLSRRFESSRNDEDDRSEESQNDMSSPSAQNEQTSQKDEDDMSSSSAEKDGNEETSKNDEDEQTSQDGGNVKEDWNVRSFYLEDDLDERLSTAVKRLDLELSESDSEIDLKKTRHVYPLLVELGLERLEEMDVTEVTERLESPDSV